MLSTEERRGFWHEPDGTPTSRSIAFQQWALAAHDVLAETAGTYHGLITEAELVDLSLAVVAINGWNRLSISLRAEPGTYQPKKQPARAAS